MGFPFCRARSSALYAASNAMLDGIARYRRAIGQPGTSIQWGAWGEAGMAALRELRRGYGFPRRARRPFELPKT